MSYNATVYRVLIASPSDVQKERNTVEAAIHAWNTQHSMDRSVVFLPVRWEDAPPRQGASGQDIINEDLVATCDAMVGVFWTKVGRPTGSGERSGTVEEIWQFGSDGRPCGLFFRKGQMPMSHDPEQYRRLLEFEGEVHSSGSDFRGLSKPFRNHSELREWVGVFLTNTLRRWSLGALVEDVELAASEGTVDLAVRDDDEPGLVEVIPVAQRAMEEIWDRLGSLNALGGHLREGPEFEEELAAPDDVLGAVEDANATFSQIADWLGGVSATLETEMPALRSAWGRLKESEALFASLLPVESPAQRERLERLVANIPGMQDTFPRMIATFEELRGRLDTFLGKSAELTRAVRRCDSALSDTIDTLIFGRAVAHHLSKVHADRLLLVADRWANGAALPPESVPGA